MSLDGLVCGCVVEDRGDGALHVVPCCADHGARWEANLEGILREMGVALPVVVTEL